MGTRRGTGYFCRLFLQGFLRGGQSFSRPTLGTDSSGTPQESRRWQTGASHFIPCPGLTSAACGLCHSFCLRDAGQAPVSRRGSMLCLCLQTQRAKQRTDSAEGQAGAALSCSWPPSSVSVDEPVHFDLQSWVEGTFSYSHFPRRLVFFTGNPTYQARLADLIWPPSSCVGCVELPGHCCAPTGMAQGRVRSPACCTGGHQPSSHSGSGTCPTPSTAPPCQLKPRRMMDGAGSLLFNSVQ